MTSTTTEQQQAAPTADCPVWCNRGSAHSVHVGHSPAISAKPIGGAWTVVAGDDGGTWVTVTAQDYPGGTGSPARWVTIDHDDPVEARKLADLIDILSRATPGDMRALAERIRANADLADA